MKAKRKQPAPAAVSPIPISRSIRVPLGASVARQLLKNLSEIKSLQANPAVLQYITLVGKDQETVAAIAEDAGHNLLEFKSWEYVTEPNGGIYLSLVPEPLPLPNPSKPE